MALPILVIVGRPNAGKSTLFNRLVGGQTAIVENIPGVTRDRNYMETSYEGRAFIAVDTGGFYSDKEDKLDVQVREQAMFAIEEADLIIHLLDGEGGLSPLDGEIASMIRSAGKGALAAVNKIDGPTKEKRLFDFYSLGYDEPMPVSAKTGYGFEELMEAALARLPEAAPEPRDYTRIAIIGRTNVGKSTLVNSLLGKSRMIVSPMPGTTRDSVDSLASYYGKKYILIDTAGIRRKVAKGYAIERFAMVRAMRSIERSDVTVIVLDAREGIVSEDQKIAGMAEAAGKGVVFLLNKWDLVADPDEALKRLQSELSRKLWFFSHAPMITTSGLEKKRITKIYPIIDAVMAERRKKIKTKELNDLIRSLPPITLKSKKIRLDFLAQTGTEPPVFRLSVNHPEDLNDAHVRHLERLLRERYGFEGTPIRIFKQEKKQRNVYVKSRRGRR